jgi:hypothetical protein
MKKAHSTGHPRSLVCVTNGSEDIETITIIDTLRRGEILVTVGKVFA